MNLWAYYVFEAKLTEDGCVLRDRQHVFHSCRGKGGPIGIHKIHLHDSVPCSPGERYSIRSGNCYNKHRWTYCLCDYVDTHIHTYIHTYTFIHKWVDVSTTWWRIVIPQFFHEEILKFSKLKKMYNIELKIICDILFSFIVKKVQFSWTSNTDLEEVTSSLMVNTWTAAFVAAVRALK